MECSRILDLIGITVCPDIHAYALAMDVASRMTPKWVIGMSCGKHEPLGYLMPCTIDLATLIGFFFAFLHLLHASVA